MKKQTRHIKLRMSAALCLTLLASCATTDKRAEIARVHGTGTITYEIVRVEKTDASKPGRAYATTEKITEEPDNYDATIAYEVLLSNKTNPRRSYVVNTVVVGATLSALRDYLSTQPKGTVVFRSDCKLTPETQDRIETVFYEEGFPLKEVWMPRSDVNLDKFTTDRAGRFRTRVEKTIYRP